MRKKLTDEAVKAAKPAKGQTRVEIYDGLCPGLVLRVGSQSKTYMFYFRHGGRFQKSTIGPAGAIKLAKARDIARAMREKVIAGLDPSEMTDEAPETFGKLCDAFLAQTKRKTKDGDRSMIVNYITPMIGHHRLVAIDGPMFARLKDKIAHQVKTKRDALASKNNFEIVKYDGARTADRVIGLCKTILRWAIPRGYVDRDFTVGIARLQSTKGRDRVLDDDELGTLLRSLPLVFPDQQRQIMIRLLILLGARKSEIMEARVDELHLVGDDPHWMLPAERSKNGHSHKVPLGPEALALFKKALALRKNSEVVFPSPETGQPYAETALHNRLKTAFRPGTTLFRQPSGKLGSVKREPLLVMPRFTIHDLRRSAATGMARIGVDRLVIGKVLNHRTADRASITGLVYDRHEYSIEKRKALTAWAAHVTTLDHGTRAFSS